MAQAVGYLQTASGVVNHEPSPPYTLPTFKRGTLYATATTLTQCRQGDGGWGEIAG